MSDRGSDNSDDDDEDVIGQLAELNELLEKEVENLQIKNDELSSENKRLRSSKRDLSSSSSSNKKNAGSTTGNNNDDDLRENVRDQYQQITKLNNDLHQANGENSDLKDQLTTMESDYENVKEERDLLNSEKKELIIQLEESKELRIKEKAKFENKMRQQDDLSKTSKKGQSELLHLLEENNELRAENERQETEVNELTVLKDDLMEALEKLDQEKDAITLQKDDLESELEEILSNRERAVKDLNDAQDKLTRANEIEADWESKAQKLKDEAAEQEKNLKEIIDREKREIHRLQDSILELKEATTLGEKEREIDHLSAKNAAMKIDLDKAKSDLDQAQADLLMLTTEYEDIQIRQQEQIDSLRINDSKYAKELESKKIQLETKLREEEAKYKELEKDVSRLQTEVEDLKNWNAIYEAGWDFKDEIRYKKKLKADIKRRDKELEMMSQRLGEAIDDREVLYSMCMRFKEEAGREPDFWYGDQEIKDSMKGEIGRLQAINRNLEEELSHAEKERIRYLHALRDNAAQISEKGIRFIGLNPDQLLLVNDFAKNLRNGTQDLPINDRSRELMSELKKVKEDHESDKTKLRRFERQLQDIEIENSTTEGGSRMTGVNNNASNQQMTVLQETMVKLLDENTALKTSISKLEQEIPKSLEEAFTHTQENFNKSIRQHSQSIDDSHVIIGANTDIETLSNRNEELERQLTDAQASYKSLMQRYETLKEDSMDGVRSKTELSMTKTQLAQAEQQIKLLMSEDRTSPSLDIFKGASPKTSHGKDLLKKQMSHLNLPPEEWADDVHDVCAQLACCMEDLIARERELEEHEELIKHYEGHLNLIRQQMSFLYNEHLDFVNTSADKEKRMKSDLEELRQERENMHIKLHRLENILELQEKCNTHPEDLHRAVKDLARKITAYEVNESVLSKKFMSVTDQLKSETTLRKRVERDMIEMETITKQRILYLEQWRVGAVQRLERYQEATLSSVPEEEFFKALRELEQLRESYLDLLQREAEARTRLAKESEAPREVKKLQKQVQNLEIEKLEAETQNETSKLALQNQIELTERITVNAVSSGQIQNQDITDMVSEIAKYRGEAARLEYEYFTVQKKLEISDRQTVEMEGKIEKLTNRTSQLESRDRESLHSAEQAKKDLLEIMNKYQGGATSDETMVLKKRIEWLEAQHSGLIRDAERYRELADIASRQVQSITDLQKDSKSELDELRSHCANLESRSDDDIIIGRLQRVLMSTKASYRAFARKHEMARLNLRKKESTCRDLEKRLDDRENTLFQIQEERTKQVKTLKETLIQLSKQGISSLDQLHIMKDLKSEIRTKTASHGRLKGVSLLDKAFTLSTTMKDLSLKISTMEKDFSENEKRRHLLETKLQELDVEKKAIRDERSDIMLLVNKLDDKSKKELAKKLITISEELRANKVGILQARREVNQLRDDKKRLEQIIEDHENTIIDLEELRVDEEANQILQLKENDTKILEHLGWDQIQNIPGLELTDNSNHKRLSGPSTSNHHNNSNPIISEPPPVSSTDKFLEKNAMTEGILNNLENLQQKNIDLMTAISELKAQKKQLISNSDEFERKLIERENALNYYIKQAKQENLPLLDGSTIKETAPSTKKAAVLSDEKELQEAATTSNNVLKHIIQEKNRTIQRYQKKIEIMRQTKFLDHNNDRREIDRLTDKVFHENQDAIGNLRSAVHNLQKSQLTDNAAHLTNKLMDQVEEATSLLQEKDETISQLEFKLRTVSNKHVRAEERCGEALSEVEKMKHDILTLAAQLQSAEERCLHGAKHHSQIPQISELQKAVTAKDQKLRGLRSAIIRLKEEFIKAEERHAIEKDNKRTDKMKRYEDKEGDLSNQIADLKDQNDALKTGLARAKEDIETARKAKDKLSRAKSLVQEENDRLSEIVSKREASTSKFEKDLTRARRELDESRKKEFRLKEKLKMREDDNREEGKSSGQMSRDGTTKSTSELEKAIKVLQAQNIALRNALGDKLSETGKNVDDVLPPHLLETDRSTTGDGSKKSAGSKETVSVDRAARHAHWEIEKKLRKRIEKLEKRLEEQSHELEIAEGQAGQAKELLARSQKDKDAVTKKVSHVAKDTEQLKQTSTADLHRFDEARARIFELEEENAVYKRKTDLEFPQKILSLQQQLHSTKDRLQEAEKAIDESEQRRKESLSKYRGENNLRDSENQYVREENLKDELAQAKRKNRELESRILERDADAMELQFDVEAKGLEIERLRRRVQELDSAYQTIASRDASGGHHKGGIDGGKGVRGSGGRFKRERDLEGVVDALKRVVEKLRAENDRLRKGAAESARLAEIQKQVRDYRHKNNELQEEITNLRARATQGDDANQRVAQKQDMINQLKRQLRSRDEQITSWKKKYDSIELSKTRIEKELELSNQQLDQLEKDLSRAKNLSREASSSRGGIDSLHIEELSSLREEVLDQKEVIKSLRKARADGGGTNSTIISLEQEVRHLKDELRENRSSSGGGNRRYRSGADSGVIAEAEQAISENKRLKQENMKLREELRAFDLDFFEEIEDLKYKYQLLREKEDARDREEQMRRR